MKFSFFLRLCLISLLSISIGCASMFSGTTQTFNLRSEQKGTKFYLNNEDLGTDSAIVQISKKNLKNSVLVAKKPGCTDAMTSINRKFDATTLLGILIDWGIISILIIDWGINGATYEAERTSYVLSPICS